MWPLREGEPHQNPREWSLYEKKEDFHYQKEERACQADTTFRHQSPLL